MHKAILKNRTALAVLAAAQGETCAIAKTECHVYIPDYHKNISGFLTDMNSQIGTLNDPSLSFNDWLNSWTGEGFCQPSKDSYLGFFFCYSNHILLFPPMSLHLVPRLHHCHNFKPTDDPFCHQKETHTCRLPWIQLPLPFVTSIYV